MSSTTPSPRIRRPRHRPLLSVPHVAVLDMARAMSASSAVGGEGPPLPGPEPHIFSPPPLACAAKGLRCALRGGSRRGLRLRRAADSGRRKCTRHLAGSFARGQELWPASGTSVRALSRRDTELDARSIGRGGCGRGAESIGPEAAGVNANRRQLQFLFPVSSSRGGAWGAAGGPGFGLGSSPSAGVSPRPGCGDGPAVCRRSVAPSTPASFSSGRCQAHECWRFATGCL